MRKYLEKLRDNSEMTQQVVADAVGVSRQYYCFIEAGKRQADMNSSIICKLADVFGVTVAEFFDMEMAYQDERAAVLEKQAPDPSA